MDKTQRPADISSLQAAGLAAVEAGALRPGVSLVLLLLDLLPLLLIVLLPAAGLGSQA